MRLNLLSAFEEEASALLAEQAFSPEKLKGDRIRAAFPIIHWVDEKNPDALDESSIESMKIALDMYRTGQVALIMVACDYFDPKMSRPGWEIQKEWFMKKGVEECDILEEKNAVDLRGDVRDSVRMMGESFEKSQLIIVIPEGIRDRGLIQLQQLREQKRVPDAETVDVLWLTVADKMEKSEVLMRNILEVLLMVRVKIQSLGIDVNASEPLEKLLQLKRRQPKRIEVFKAEKFEADLSAKTERYAENSYITHGLNADVQQNARKKMKADALYRELLDDCVSALSRIDNKEATMEIIEKTLLEYRHGNGYPLFGESGRSDFYRELALRLAKLSVKPENTNVCVLP
ncbi:hypothetical protein HY463_01355 [Candidatus Peregrinibacteria bacterium]|nr:hypothetical protein [Candidatus Peregrinibacteria bacterium]